VGLRQSASKRKARSKHSIKSIWEVHNELDTIGGPVTFGQHIRLRHFDTGAFLAIRRDFNGVARGVALPVIDNIRDKVFTTATSLLLLTFAFQSPHCLNNNTFAYLCTPFPLSHSLSHT
jgi:hypothetical protein